MMAQKSINVKPLITNKFSINKSIEAYEILSNPSAIGILLTYDQSIKSTSKKQAKIELEVQKKTNNFMRFFI